MRKGMKQILWSTTGLFLIGSAPAWGLQEPPTPTPDAAQQPSSETAQPSATAPEADAPSQPESAAQQPAQAPQAQPANPQPSQPQSPSPNQRGQQGDAGQSSPAPDAARGQNGQQAGQQPRSDQAAEDQSGAMLGVIVTPAPGDSVLVRAVVPGGAAAQAGIQPGDYLLRANNQPLISPEELAEVVQSMQTGQELQLTVWRDGQEQSITARLSDQQLGFRGQEQGEQGSVDRQAGQGERGQAWLGVVLRAGQEGHGVMVEQVYPNGPAARAGVRAGDTLLSIGDQQVASPEEATRAIQNAGAGREASILVRRDGEQQQLNVRLGSRDEFFSRGGANVGSRPAPPDGSEARDRRVADYRDLVEHNQRMEQLLRELQGEVRQLREQVQALSDSGQGQQQPQQ